MNIIARPSKEGDTTAAVAVSISADIINSTNANEIGNALEPLVALGYYAFIVDLCNVRHMGSAGVKELTTIYKKSQRLNKTSDMKLVLPEGDSNPKEVLDTCGITQIWEVLSPTDPLVVKLFAAIVSAQ